MGHVSGSASESKYFSPSETTASGLKPSTFRYLGKDNRNKQNARYLKGMLEYNILPTKIGDIVVPTYKEP